MASKVQFSYLNTYKKPPEGICNFSEVEIFCNERLQLYNILQQAGNFDLKRHEDNWTNYLFKFISNNFFLETYKILLSEKIGAHTVKAQRQDQIAHWFLSLCYSKNENLRKHFIKCELDWIALLCHSNIENIVTDILNSNNLKYQKVESEEKEELKEKLICCRKSVNLENFDKTVYFKADFENILKLVSDREIFILNGNAYFPQNDIIYLLECKLYFQIKEQLNWNIKMLPNLEKNEQIQTIFKLFPVEVPEITVQTVDITLHDLEHVSKDFYPLCMRNIHNALKSFHHLKHDCRKLYGIFLKNLGLPFEDAMEFFEQEFTKSMSKNWFNRKYAYYFKHYYGKVGGKIDYKPHSCQLILKMAPGPQQYHGCPFKHWDKEVLIKEITKDGLGFRDIKDIEELISDKSYQHACTRYYSSVRKVFRDDIIVSPNQYCVEGIRYEMSLDNLLDSICDTV